MSPVSIWEQMDVNQLVMKPYSDFIRCKCFVCYPIPHIAEKLMELNGYLQPTYTDILITTPILPGSFPYFTKHFFMKVDKKAL